MGHQKDNLNTSLTSGLFRFGKLVFGNPNLLLPYFSSGAHNICLSIYILKLGAPHTTLGWRWQICPWLPSGTCHKMELF